MATDNKCFSMYFGLREFIRCTHRGSIMAAWVVDSWPHGCWDRGSPRYQNDRCSQVHLQYAELKLSHLTCAMVSHMFKRIHPECPRRRVRRPPPRVERASGRSKQTIQSSSCGHLDPIQQLGQLIGNRPFAMLPARNQSDLNGKLLI